MKFTEALERIKHIEILMTLAEQEYLFNAAQKYGGQRIVEIGAFKGGSTSLLCLAAPQAHVVSFDIFTHLHGVPSPELLYENLLKAGVTNHTLIEMDSMLVKWDEPIDLLFIDGDHEYTHVLHDLQTFSPHAKYMLMHDIQKPGVSRATREYIGKEWTCIQHPVHLGLWRHETSAHRRS